MTLSQRLVRAGLVFILFGAVASVLPSDGNAMATQKCVNGVTYTFGQSSTDAMTSTMTTTAGVTLTAYQGSTAASASFSETDTTNFTYTVSADSITVTPKMSSPTGHSTDIKATFDGVALVYTVSD